MLEDYIKEQEIVTNLLLESFKNNKLVQAYLIVSSDNDYSLKYAKSFAKKLITSDYNTNICTKIDKNIYSELKIINPISNVVKKEQLLDLQNDFKTKPIEGNKRVYIINECDKLNSSSANSILKFLEEPQDDIIAILLTNNISKVLPTIISRCQILNLSNLDNKSKDITEIIYKNYIKIYENIEINDKEYTNYFENLIYYCESIEKENLKFIIKYKDFFDNLKNKEDIENFLIVLLYFYYDMLNLKIDKNIHYMLNYEEILKKYMEKNDINKLIYKIRIVEDIKYKLSSNMNLKLLFDEFLIKLNEVS